MNKSIYLLPKDKWDEALQLVKEVFMEFEAPDYGDEGVAEIMRSFRDESYLNMHTFYGAYQDDKLVGVIATSSTKNWDLWIPVRNRHRTEYVIIR